jgi:hypothetical protein
MTIEHWRQTLDALGYQRLDCSWGKPPAAAGRSRAINLDMITDLYENEKASFPESDLEVREDKFEPFWKWWLEIVIGVVLMMGMSVPMKHKKILLWLHLPMRVQAEDSSHSDQVVMIILVLALVGLAAVVHGIWRVFRSCRRRGVADTYLVYPKGRKLMYKAA